METTMRDDERRSDHGKSALIREVLLSFWKIHILHHAEEGSVYGHWMLGELRRHGYDISPGTLYPLLRRMERHGWLAPLASAARANIHSRREYRLTRAGAEALEVIRVQLQELRGEVLEKWRPGGRPARGGRRQGTGGGPR
jgi:DNA-binding PadR family transcriptional regulator